MRFQIQYTADGSPTLFDTEVGETFKSSHAAATETEAVFFAPAVLENSLLHGKDGSDFAILELGFGLGTNLFHAMARAQDFSLSNFSYTTIERDLAGASAYLDKVKKDPLLAEFLREKKLVAKNFSASLVVEDFFIALRALRASGKKFQAIYFDPFSPKANPEAWSTELFSLCYELLVPQGRLVTYSVSRTAKDGLSAAGFNVSKRKLPEILNKRESLLAVK